MATTDPRPSEPRRFSIRLPRPLWIGLVAVVLILLGLGMSLGYPIYQEQAAARRFEKLDCTFLRESRLPFWLQEWVGEDFLTNEIGNVWHADLGEARISDADIPFIRSLSGVRYLGVNDSSITDSGLAHFGIMPDLAILDLSRTQVTDAGLQHLRRFPALAVLWLSSCNITDDGLKYAAELPSLESIRLDHTKVTAAGIARLRTSRPALEIELGIWNIGDETVEQPEGR